VLGGLPARPDLAVPERHLGLVAADLVADPDWIGRLAAWAAEFVDLDAVVALAGGGVPSAGGDGLVALPSRESGTASREAATPQGATARRVRIGVARDAAFHFYYADNLDLLEEAGAELVPFSPLTDARLPNVDGLYLGGGYPEEHAAALTANASMRASIRAFAEAGGTIYAECGGLMYLGDALEDAAGAHPMCGVLPLTTRMTPALRSFGYRDVVTTADTLFGPAGTRWKGHEFHYSELASNALAPVFQTKGWGGEGVEGWAKGRVLGTYVHAHFGSNGGMVEGFLRGCAAPLHADPRRPT
jgi:cobyrinic acid a,c-diamide synthase